MRRRRGRRRLSGLSWDDVVVPILMAALLAALFS
jgi:hypothetical protein